MPETRAAAAKKAKAEGVLLLQDLDWDMYTMVMCKFSLSGESWQDRINKMATLRLVNKFNAKFLAKIMYEVTFTTIFKPRTMSTNYVNDSCAAMADAMGMTMFKIIRRGTDQMCLDAVKFMKRVNGATDLADKMRAISEGIGYTADQVDETVKALELAQESAREAAALLLE